MGQRRRSGEKELSRWRDSDRFGAFDDDAKALRKLRHPSRSKKLKDYLE